MSVDEALSFILQKFQKINAKLQTLCDVGLGYITLGQNATLSGGGSKIKLSKELSKKRYWKYIVCT